MHQNNKLELCFSRIILLLIKIFNLNKVVVGGKGARSMLYVSALLKLEFERGRSIPVCGIKRM